MLFKHLLHKPKAKALDFLASKVLHYTGHLWDVCLKPGQSLHFPTEEAAAFSTILDFLLSEFSFCLKLLPLVLEFSEESTDVSALILGLAPELSFQLRFKCARIL